jgi:hypothetical protein
MSGAMPPLPQYVSMASCLIKQERRLRGVVLSKTLRYLYSVLHQNPLKVKSILLLCGVDSTWYGGENDW